MTEGPIIIGILVVGLVAIVAIVFGKSVRARGKDEEGNSADITID